MKRRLPLAMGPILERCALFSRFFERVSTVSRSASTHRLHQGIVICSLVSLAMLLAAPGTLAAKAASAAPNPQVLVAVDATSPSCTYVTTPGNHTHSAGNAVTQGTLSTTRMPCPAGTIMELASVPLSQATANHETYVLPLSPQASLAQHKQWIDQVERLMLAKKRALQTKQTVSTSASCGYTTTVDTSTVVYNESLDPSITYYVSSDCSQVYLDTVSTYVGYVPYNNILYWYEFDYAAYVAQCYPPDFEFFHYTTYSFHPDQWHARGYYGLFKYSQFGDPCHANGGPIDTVGVGPVS